MTPNPARRDAPWPGSPAGTAGGGTAGSWQQTLQTTVLKRRAAVGQDQALNPGGGSLGLALGCKGAFTA